MKILVFGVLLRISLLIYGGYQDQLPVLKYTDIDYCVFTDAAKEQNPYRRATYRYTPLLAILMYPNQHYITFGKLLFCFADLITGFFLERILLLMGKSPIYSALWTLNPFVAVISSRGNAESIMSALVMATLWAVMSNRLSLAALIYGISVHFKIYPIIYAVPLWFGIDHGNVFYRRIFTFKRIYFGLLSFFIFASITLAMYILYGEEFINETYLYHIIRKDHRHNFSLYFYHIYLSLDSINSQLVAILLFVPQILLILILGVAFAGNLPLALFLQTFTFVMLNKVSTSQYFMWYLCFLPLVLSNTKLKPKVGLALLAFWISSQGSWLYFAFQLEHLGMNTFLQLWISSIGFFISQVMITVAFIVNS